MQDWSHTLQAWRDFYTFAGAAAATLVGLMFVVMSLGQRTLRTEEGARAMSAFFTPIVIFFTTVIVVAMLMMIPAPPPGVLGAMFVAVAVIGVAYMIASGAHRVWWTSKLGLDDLAWYIVLPYVSYAAIGVAGAAIGKASAIGLYTAATAMLLLLLVGIRNAWDLVVFTIQRGGGES